MPTLYDNFERVRQYIDQHQVDVDLSSYVSYAYLESKNYIDDNVNLLHGPLFVDYSTPQNDSYTLSSYSHIVAGTEDKTGVSFVATKRKCGGEDGTTYMAAFFTNSDGRSKFVHKTKISNTGVGAQSDDAFMCFNAYGFRIAYSGTEGVSASTEYEILHEGNIGNLGYITADDVAAMGYVTSVPVIDENIIPKETGTYTLGDADHLYAASYTKSTYFTNNTKIVGSGSDINFYTGGLSRIKINNNILRPDRTGVDLGTSSNKWGATYTTNLYTNTAYLQDTSYTKSIVPAENESYTLGDTSNYYHTLYANRIQGNSSVNIRTGGNNRVTITTTALRPMQQNYNLGSSDYPFATAYISNIYNFIWTGTSAQYAALDNYTSYQIYMIKES